MRKVNSQNIIDQRSDRSQKFLYKALSKYASEDLAEAVGGMELPKVALTKVASGDFADRDRARFPVNSLQDCVLSKVYFDAQKDQYEEKTAAQIERRLNTYLDVYEVPEELFKLKPDGSEKTAAEGPETFYLLPSYNACPVQTVEDLDKAAEYFEEAITDLNLPERVEFSQQFVKYASKMNRSEYPHSIAKYAAKLDSDLYNLQEALRHRAALANRKGYDSAKFNKLAEYLDKVDEEDELSGEQLMKLADTIYRLDKACDFEDLDYDYRIPDAYSAVFNKEATDNSQGGDEVRQVSKDQVIGELGEEVLDDLEDEDGNIDMSKYQKLKSILKAKDEDN